jgi:hypothetical protein
MVFHQGGIDAGFLRNIAQRYLDRAALAATSSLSAVLFLPPGSRVGTLVFNSDPIPAYVPMTRRSEHAGADNPMPPPHSRVN